MKKIIFVAVLQSVLIFPLYKTTASKVNQLSPQVGYASLSSGLLKPTTVKLAPNFNWWDKPSKKSEDNWWDNKKSSSFDTSFNYDYPSDPDFLDKWKKEGFRTLADKGSQAYVYTHPKIKNIRRNLEDISEDIYTRLYSEQKKEPETMREYLSDLWSSTAKDRIRKLEDMNDFWRYQFMTAGAKVAPELYEMDITLHDLAEKILAQRKFYDQKSYTNEDVTDLTSFLWAILFAAGTGATTGITIGLARDISALIHEYILEKRQEDSDQEDSIEY